MLSPNKAKYDYLKSLVATSGDVVISTGGEEISSPNKSGDRRRVNKTSTTVTPNSTRPIIVNSQQQIDQYKKLYPSQSNNLKFLIRKGYGNPNSFVEKFKQQIITNKKISLKGSELGNGGDITQDLFNVLTNLTRILIINPKYTIIPQIVITAGNDAYHQGKTLNINSSYGTNGVFPYTTTHTRGLAIDVRSINPQIDNLIIDALEEAGFTGILWHNPPHIHANIQ